MIISKSAPSDEMVHSTRTFLKTQENSDFWNDFVYIDIDECSMATNNCHDNATCTDTTGSFACICRPGFTGGGTDCSGRSMLILTTY